MYDILHFRAPLCKKVRLQCKYDVDVSLNVVGGKIMQHRSVIRGWIEKFHNGIITLWTQVAME